MTPPGTTGVLEPALDEVLVGRPPRPPAHGGGGPFDPTGPPGRAGGGARAAEPPISSAWLAMLAFIVFESMLFVPLMGSFVVIRWAHLKWPPPGQPYLPIAVTWMNTFVLLGSLVPLGLARKARAAGVRAPFVRWLAVAAAMGALFLAVQGFEWTRLLAQGIKVADNVYGGLLLLLIGAHALHVLGATIALGVLAILAALGRGRVERGTAFGLSAMYWIFVCVLWIALFVLVYLL